MRPNRDECIDAEHAANYDERVGKLDAKLVIVCVEAAPNVM